MWHTQSSNSFLLFVSKDFTTSSVDIVNLSVQMLEFELKANEGLNKSNFFLHKEVSSFSCENIMRLFLDNENQISCMCIRLYKVKITN